MTKYLDPHTLEEAMREIRFSRKEIERLRQRVKELEAVEAMRDEEIAALREKCGNQSIELDAERQRVKELENVAAAEREACAKVCEDRIGKWCDGVPDNIVKFIDAESYACALYIRKRSTPQTSEPEDK